MAQCENPTPEHGGDTCPACEAALARAKADHPTAYIPRPALRLVKDCE